MEEGKTKERKRMIMRAVVTPALRLIGHEGDRPKQVSWANDQMVKASQLHVSELSSSTCALQKKKASGSRNEKVLISFESDANYKVGSERLNMGEVGVFKAI